MENRSMFVERPTEYLDNVVGSMDAFETELKSLSNHVVCLYSNSLLLNGGREYAEKFKAVVSSSPSVKVVLAISVPDSIRDEVQGAEYLASHVHYGSSNGLFFGLLGPLVIDSDCSQACLNMYLTAQSKTGHVGLLVQVLDLNRATELFQHADVDFSRIVFIGSLTVEDVTRLDRIAGRPVTVCLTGRPDEQLTATGRSMGEAMQVFNQLGNRVMASTGTQFKTDHIRYGGSGIMAFPRFLANRGVVVSNHLARSLLMFHWDPPKLTVLQQESEKWVCDVCGFTARLNEKENYTKHGFTYCSIPCLAEHRKRGFTSL
jgi:hypothetical protein